MTTRTEKKKPGRQPGRTKLANELWSKVARLPRADRDDLYELVEALHEGVDQDEQESILAAMNEIIERPPMSTSPLTPPPVVGRKPGPKKKQEWAKWAGKRVRSLRTKAGLTQVQLAQKADIPQGHVSRIETGDLSPTHKTVRKIADALGVSVGEIDPNFDRAAD